MKSTILVLVSMFILSGCDSPISPGGWDWPSKPKEKYIAIIKVSTFSGKPCTTAIIIFHPYTFRADAAGIIHAHFKTTYIDTIINHHTTVYKYDSETSPVWEGAIPFAIDTLGTPEPFEVVFPDSP